jgi:hypothetical protein
MRITANDDSGFLAVVDPHAYRGFVSESWTYDTLFGHFAAAMAERSLLIWGTGREDEWTVDVSVGDPVPGTAFRRISGPIRVTAGALLLTSYESLTMAAQFGDVALPEEHERDQVFELPSGDYVCEVVQWADPDEDADEPDTRFTLTFTPGRDAPSWTAPPWHA